MRVVDGVLHLAAFTPLNPQADSALTSIFPMPTSATRFFERIARGEPYQEPDTEVAPLERGRQIARERGYRSSLIVPLMNAGQAIGAVSVTRVMPSAFTPEDVQLLQTFADQAVIAIENTRLFNETKERWSGRPRPPRCCRLSPDSPGELKPVFNAMLENAVRICEAKFGNLFLVDGDSCCWTAGVNTPEKLAQYFTESTSFRPTPGSHLRSRDRDKRKSGDTADDTAEAVVGAAARFGGARSTVCVPMVKDDALVGAIFIYRTEVRPFTDKQIDLVKELRCPGRDSHRECAAVRGGSGQDR